MPPESIGPYRVVGKIGEGGMGEVYRARDAVLQREVAIKVLPAAMADNPRRLRRFEREAQALAALNHPNIATVHRVLGPADGAGIERALVMELVEGEDLSWRIARGRIPLREALSIARQVADALAAAHDAGIVHRDLKPANIKVRDDGTVKVLDFGLAKAGTPDSASGDRERLMERPLALPPTITLASDLTMDGDVVGTAVYMAPEQARGDSVDKRTDIWAFGVVLFEMLAGQKPFLDRDVAADPGGHAERRIPWDRLPAETPPPIRRLLARALAPDRRQRLNDMADARLEIDEAMTPPQPFERDGRTTGSPGRGRRWGYAAALVITGLTAGLALAVASLNPAVEPPLVSRSVLAVPPAEAVDSWGMHPEVVLPAGGARTALAWSGDGRTLAFIGVAGGIRRIYLRDLAAEDARPLAGTEGAGALAFSPTGDELAFWSGGVLWKIKAAGGPASKICDAQTLNGLTWGEGRIVFGFSPLLLEVAPAGGVPRQITHATELVRHGAPSLLPGGRTLLYTEYERQWTSGDERVMLMPLDPPGEPRLLLREAAAARYLPTGHLAFLRQGTLFVVPFDLASLTLRGDPVAVVKGVAQSVAAWDSDDLTLEGHYAVSSRGALAYVASALTAFPDRELVSIDRSGQVSSIGAPLRGYRNHVELAPDGLRLAVSIQSAHDVRPFVYDFRRGTLGRVAESVRGEVVVAAWSKDDRLAVQVVSAGKIVAAVVRPELGSTAVPVSGSTSFWASSWSGDGRLIGMKGGHLWVYPSGGVPAPESELFASSATELQPAWSPDGLWIAYSSNATGRSEIYIRPASGVGAPIPVSTEGGTSPAWNPNGRELFYVESGQGQDRMMSVEVARPGRPERSRPLFAFSRDRLVLSYGVLTPYAVAPGGRRFYAVRQPAPLRAPVGEIHLVLNWFDELRLKASRQPPGG